MKLSHFISCLTILFLFAFTAQPAHSQIVDKTENKAKRKANQRVDRKIDNGIDKGLDAVEGLFKRKNKKKKKNKSAEKQQQESSTESVDNSSQKDQAKNPMMEMYGADPGEVEDTYSFDHSVELLVQNYNKKGKLEDESTVTMLVSDSKKMFGMKSKAEQGGATMIFDVDNSQMITMTEGQGNQNMGMIMELNPEGFEDEEEVESEVTFTKTGRTKTISGYSCEEYKMENSEADEDYDYFMWTTEDDEFNWIEAFTEMMQHQKMNRTQAAEGYPEGMMVQMVTESKNSDQKTVTTVQDIQMNGNFDVSTEGYQFMSMGGGR